MIHIPRGTREPPPGGAPPPAPPEDGAAALADGRIVERSRSEPEAFAELYDRHAPAVHRYVRRRLGEQAAEDIVAETFLAAFRQRNRYDTARPDARPWLYGIAANLVGKHRRSETRKLRALARTGVDPVADTATERVDERVSASAASRRLARALAGLSAGDREVLLLAACPPRDPIPAGTVFGDQALEAAAIVDEPGVRP
ncbi:RNA polymerase sigma factor [Actinomadura sp. WAC 06369]|uniref:RNA polymerase sigma factor n=1 Tax=Actinomadura sp. WAC 06369 TaxID=2203193 RepID=UPI000F7B0181|nr:RNA polymerase sigma factor [Actinomadura sp. WAC 06369]RSN46728.1 RNA polymerase subunit sigma-70 [Actinomadura sp. WAC 06369]